MKYINLWNCPKCQGPTNTFRHPFAKVWCPACGHVLREEGDQTIMHKEDIKMGEIKDGQ
jgi:ribosomal protein S27E